jgi:hypothetical protein
MISIIAHFFQIQEPWGPVFKWINISCTHYTLPKTWYYISIEFCNKFKLGILYVWSFTTNQKQSIMYKIQFTCQFFQKNTQFVYLINLNLCSRLFFQDFDFCFTFFKILILWFDFYFWSILLKGCQFKSKSHELDLLLPPKFNNPPFPKANLSFMIIIQSIKKIAIIIISVDS